MPLSLDAPDGVPAVPGSWNEPRAYWSSIAAATAHLEPPFGILHAEALRANARDLVERAAGTPIRIASKSLRVRSVVEALLRMQGFSGVLAYTLPEALWLAESVEDVVVGYPSVDREAIGRLVRDERAASRVTLMVDSVEHLDLVDAIAPPRGRETVRVCIELDASWRSRGPFGTVGVHRSPLHSADEVETLARVVVERPGFVLVGLMAYEAQIAGVGDATGRRALDASVSVMQRRSLAELRERRGRAVERVRRLAPLEFVNGGGTGSLERTRQDPSVTELAAGSGLFAGHLFDGYSRFTPAPAAAFALSVVRKPSPSVATVLGGGWVASGPPGVDRLPAPVHPVGLRYVRRESAGEVQTPLRGASARALRSGDRVWFRHAKSGEVSERLGAFALLEHGAGSLGVVDHLPTYRGEGRAFV